MIRNFCSACWKPTRLGSDLGTCTKCGRTYHASKCAEAARLTNRNCGQCRHQSPQLPANGSPPVLPTVNNGQGSTDASTGSHASSTASRATQPRFEAQCHAPGCSMSTELGRKFCRLHPERLRSTVPTATSHAQPLPLSASQQTPQPASRPASSQPVSQPPPQLASQPASQSAPKSVPQTGPQPVLRSVPRPAPQPPPTQLSTQTPQVSVNGGFSIKTSGLPSASLDVRSNGFPRQLGPSPMLPANSRLGPEFAERSGKTARKGSVGLNRSPFAQNSHVSSPPHLRGSPVAGRASFRPSMQTVHPSGSSTDQHNAGPSANPTNATVNPNPIKSSPGRLQVFPARYSPVQRAPPVFKITANNAETVPAETRPPIPPHRVPFNVASTNKRKRADSFALELEAKAEEWHAKRVSSGASFRPGTGMAGSTLFGGVSATLHDEKMRKLARSPFAITSGSQEGTIPSQVAHPSQRLGPDRSARVMSLLSKLGISARLSPPKPGDPQRIDGPEKTSRPPHGSSLENRRVGLIESFDQAKFDASFYAQEDAGPPPTGVSAPKRREERPPPPGEDNRLYLPLDPRIHWPRSWTAEWYAAKMDEIKARGGKKANWGRVTARMRERRMRETEFARREEAAAQAGKTPPRREPQPWAHRRPVDFSDIPEEELPEDVKSNAAWLGAAAWMRSVRQKTRERDRHAKQLLAQGKPIDHLLGPTGW